MKTFNQKLQNLMKLGLLTTVILSFIACSEESDPVTAGSNNISGKWIGTIDHPAYYSGNLDLQVLQTGEAISGTFVMILHKGYSGETYNGTISGAKTSNNNYTIYLTGTNFTWISSLTLNSVTLSGSWQSSSNSLSGSLSVKKN